jgi:carboxypeptidase C (cathepsin A)
MWIYPILKANGYKLLFYSGDTDGAVPTYGTKRWIKELEWPIKKEWRQWKTDGQVSGYIQEYEGLDFVTIKGVGHMAPQYARKAVTSMITAHIHGEPF